MEGRIKKKEYVAKSTLYVEFDLLGARVDFLPGQFFFIELDGLRKHFTVVNPPTRNTILSLCTRIRQSPFKKALSQSQIGAPVELGPILGDFVLPQKSSQPLCFIAGGIGITPFASMLSYLEDLKRKENITLVWSNRDKRTTPFFERIKQLADKGFCRLVATMTQDESWPGETGRIDKAFIKKQLPDWQQMQFFVAGPPAFVENIAEILRSIGVSQKNLKTENFTGY